MHNYDEDGRNVEMVEDGYMADSTYDAAGRLIRSISGDPNHAPGFTDDIYTYYDGEGRMLKRLQKDYLYVDPQDILQGLHWVDRPLQYYIRSSVLGGEVVTEVNSTGKKLKTFVRAAGAVIAWQTLYHPTSGGPTETLRFEHSDAAGMTRKMTMENGNTVAQLGAESDAAELDASGSNAGVENPYPTMPAPFPGEGCIGCDSNGMAIMDNNSVRMVNGKKETCTLNHMKYDCDSLENLAVNGATISEAQDRKEDADRRRRAATPKLKLNKKKKDRRRADKIAGDRRAATGRFDNEADVEQKIEFIDAGSDLTNGSTLSKFNYFRNFISSRVKFVGDPDSFINRERDGLIARLAWLVGLKSCNEQFKSKFGKSSYDLIKERGLYITDYGSLENPANATALGISESDRVGLLERRDARRPYASTASDLPIGIVTIFNETEINVNWLWSFYSGTKDAILNEAVPHEMIHGAGEGVKNVPGLFFQGHDLNALPGYDKVIDNCIIPGGTRIF